MTKFDPTKPVQTRCGQEAKIEWTDGGGSEPLGGWVRDFSGNKMGCSWSAAGIWRMSEKASELDLINIPEKPTTIERWVNVYSDCTVLHGSKEDADYNARFSGSALPDRIACVKISGTFTPGEGLDE